MKLSDRELVERSVAGNADAFQELVARYQTLVCSIAYSAIGDFARSEEIGQDALVAAWQALATLSDGDKFKPWLSSITRNLAHNAVRNDKLRKFDQLPDVPANNAASPSERAARREEEALAWRALSRLPEKYREPLVLFYRQEQSIAEVALSLDESTDVIKQRLSRGRKMLRDELVAAVAGALKRSAPARAFTTVVMAAIMGAASTAAAAAGTSAVIGKAALSTTGWKSAGALGGAGWLTGLGGAALGTWCSWLSAEYQSQRDFIRRQTIVFAIGLAVFSVPFAAMMLGWRPVAAFGQSGYAVALLAWMGLFMGLNLLWIGAGLQRARTITAAAQSSEAPRLPTTKLRQWIAQWQGRRWRTRFELAGRPLVDISFADPGGQQSAPPARGWIAIGDHARGYLLAIGNIAVAPIAIGTLSAGILSFGVLSVGVVALGVLAIAPLAAGVGTIGGWSVGGAAALGYEAAGPAAIGWNGASGAAAFARHHAKGAVALARHVNDEAARNYFAESAFFNRSDRGLATLVEWSRSPYRHFIWPAACLLLIAMWTTAYRRKSLPP